MEDLQPVVTGTRLVPEKRALSVATQSKLHSHFWNSSVKSTRTPDVAITAASCEPAPLSLLTPSGLSRVQFLQATQAAGIPATPSFAGSQGGVVVDRALSMHGGQRWWAAFVGRVKVQQLLKRQRQNGTVKALVDPSLYALHGVLRARPSRTTLLRASIQADSLAGLVAPPPTGPAPRLTDALSASSELTAHINSSHKLTGRLSANELVLTAPATYSRTPFTATLDLEPLPQRQSPHLYRLGFHQTVRRLEQGEQKPQGARPSTAAANEAPREGVVEQQGGAVRGGAASSSGRRLLQDFASSYSAATAFQGAVAVHGTRVLWQSRRGGSSGGQEPGSQPEEPSGGPAGAPATKQPPPSRRATGSYQDGSEGSENGRLITAGDMLAALSDSAGALREATQQLSDAAGWVRSGAFKDALRGRGSSGRDAGRQPRSSFLAGPQLQATGLLGAAARTGFSSTGGLAPPALAPFASGGLSLQLGWFARPLLDFTRLSAQLDLGLPRSASTSPAPSPSPSPAPPLGAPDARPSATLSVSQQLYGPLRLNADWRLALDSDAPLASCRAHPQEQVVGAWRHVRGLRPSLLDAAYALDVVVPGTKGLARVVAWYAPLRQEGMVEFRLL